MKRFPIFRLLDSTLAELIQDLSYTPEEKQFLSFLSESMIGITAQEKMTGFILKSISEVQNPARITPSFVREILHRIKIKNDFRADGAIQNIL